MMTDGKVEVKNRSPKGPTRYWKVMRGNLYARLQYRDSAGHWREKLRPITEKKVARSVVEQMRRDLATHGEESLMHEQITFAEFAPIYKSARLTPPVYANGVKVSGIKSRVSWAYDSLLAYFGRTTLRSLKPRHLEKYKLDRLNTTTRQGTPRSITTVNRELALFRAMLNYAVQNDFLLQNPFTKARGIIVVSAEKERDRVLSYDEEVRLLEACIGDRAHLRPIVICALDTAMRSGEMFKLEWRDVDLEKGEIIVLKQNTKTERQRVIGMTPRLKLELEAVWNSSDQNGSSLVFGITNTVKRSWSTACELAKLKDFRLHDCRHTATTRMIAAGIPHMEVMKITGHSQIKTFLRYMNLTAETANRAADRLGEYLSGRQGDQKMKSAEVIETSSIN